MATKKVDLAGLQEYDKGVKNALSKKAEKEHIHDTYTTSEIDDKIQNRTGKVVVIDVESDQVTVGHMKLIYNEYLNGNTVVIRKGTTYTLISHIQAGKDSDNNIRSLLMYAVTAVWGVFEYSCTTDKSDDSFVTAKPASPVHTHKIKDIKDFFIGSYEEYEAAYNTGSIPVGAFVVITDDDEEDEASSPILGVGQLDSMILG